MKKDVYKEKVVKAINRGIKKHETKRQGSPACGPLSDDIYEELRNEGVLRPPAKEA